MPEFYRFFDSTVDDEREYTADDFAEYFRTVLTDGIFNGGTNLKVSADGTNMDLNLADGYAWLQGYMYKVDGGHKLTVDTADPSLNRIDRVILRLDKTLEQRNIKAIILKGTPAASPVVPALTRDENIFDISLAQISVTAGKSFIEGFQITDERLNTSVCGLVNSLIQADTTEIFNQFQEWYNSKTAEFQQEWDDWFSTTTDAHEIELATWFGGVQDEWNTWFGAQQQDGYVIESQRNQPNGFLGLNNQGKASLEQLPPLDYIPNSEKGTDSGVATLDDNGKVLSTQLRRTEFPIYEDGVHWYNDVSFPNSRFYKGGINTSHIVLVGQGGDSLTHKPIVCLNANTRAVVWRGTIPSTVVDIIVNSTYAFVATQNGIYRYTLSSGSRSTLSTGDQCVAMGSDSAGNIVIGITNYMGSSSYEYRMKSFTPSGTQRWSNLMETSSSGKSIMAITKNCSDSGYVYMWRDGYAHKVNSSNGAVVSTSERKSTGAISMVYKDGILFVARNNSTNIFVFTVASWTSGTVEISPPGSTGTGQEFTLSNDGDFLYSFYYSSGAYGGLIKFKYNTAGAFEVTGQVIYNTLAIHIESPSGELYTLGDSILSILRRAIT